MCQELQPTVGDLRYAVLHSMLLTVTKNPQNVQKALKNFTEILNVDVRLFGSFDAIFSFSVLLLALESWNSASSNWSESPRVGPGYPLSAIAPPLSIHFLIFCSLLLFLFPFLIHFTYFLLLSIQSLSTRIVPLRFQAWGRRRRPYLGLVWLCYLYCLVEIYSGVLSYLI